MSIRRRERGVCERRRSYLADPESRITSEKAFADLWERSLELKPEVIGRDGKSYEILFPGVRNQGAGPDFEGAVLRYDGRTIGGDVELHLDSGGWRAHGHHRDSRYRGVVLQVVLRAHRERSDTQSPPTAEARFEIGAHSSTPVTETPDLETLGFQRFLAKSAGFRLEFESATDLDQAVYASLLDAMGYARNRRPFRELAGRVPFSAFTGLAREPASSAEFAVLSALVVGGGLLPESEIHERVQMSRLARGLGIRRKVGSDDWSRFRIRPSNTPISRMRGIAPLIVRSLRAGLIATLEDVFDREGVSGLIHDVQERPFIGRGLAVTVAANVALPTLHAVALLRGGSGTDRIEREFGTMPAPPQDAVTRGACAVLGLDLRPKLASQHFGLHALARSESWPGARPVSRRDRRSSPPPPRCAASP